VVCGRSPGQAQDRPEARPDGHGLDRADAEGRLRDLVSDVAPPAHSRVTLEVAGRHLIEHLRALGRKPSTAESYESMIRVHLAPHFAGRSLDAITPDDLEGYVRAKSRDGKSAKTITNHVRFLHSIFAFGQRRGWAKQNPCALIDKPGTDGANADIRFLDPSWGRRSGPRRESATGWRRRWRSPTASPA
jgi:Phage integrase, N-terminal SAM-like domain